MASLLGQGIGCICHHNCPPIHLLRPILFHDLDGMDFKATFKCAHDLKGFLFYHPPSRTLKVRRDLEFPPDTGPTVGKGGVTDNPILQKLWSHERPFADEPDITPTKSDSSCVGNEGVPTTRYIPYRSTATKRSHAS